MPATFGGAQAFMPGVLDVSMEQKNIGQFYQFCSAFWDCREHKNRLC